MSRSVNRVALLGYVGAEPEIRTTAAGVKLAKVSLATNERWKGREGQQEGRTDWHQLTFWDRLADVAEQYVHKGDRLYVEGPLRRNAVVQDDGTTTYYTEVHVRELVLLGSPGGQNRPETFGSSSGGGHGTPGASRASQAAYDDDLPF